MLTRKPPTKPSTNPPQNTPSAPKHRITARLALRKARIPNISTNPSRTIHSYETFSAPISDSFDSIIGFIDVQNAHNLREIDRTPLFSDLEAVANLKFFNRASSALTASRPERFILTSYI
jgi:hypothetical protein